MNTITNEGVESAIIKVSNAQQQERTYYIEAYANIAHGGKVNTVDRGTVRHAEGYSVASFSSYSDNSMHLSYEVNDERIAILEAVEAFVAAVREEAPAFID